MSLETVLIAFCQRRFFIRRAINTPAITRIATTTATTPHHTSNEKVNDMVNIERTKTTVAQTSNTCNSNANNFGSIAVIFNEVGVRLVNTTVDTAWCRVGRWRLTAARDVRACLCCGWQVWQGFRRRRRRRRHDLPCGCLRGCLPVLGGR